MRHAHFSDGQIYTWSAIPKPLEATMRETYPEITHSALMTWQNKLLFTKEEKAAREWGRFVGNEFLEIFSFPLLVGDPATALAEIHNVVLTEELADKYYGTEWRNNPQAILGQILKIDNRQDFQVSGVLAKLPSNSTLQFDFLLNVEEFIQRNDWLDHWGNNSLRMFVKLQEGTDLMAFNEKLINVIRDNRDNNPNVDVFLQPYEDIHLHNEYQQGQLVGGRIEYVRIFFIVALFLLLIACINYMNLATARSLRRAREIGVRKVVGAQKHTLMGQFLMESVLLAVISLVIALLIVHAVLPAFNTLTGKEIHFSIFHLPYLGTALGIALLVGLLAGSYPAFFLSSIRLTRVLKGTLKHTKSSAYFRKGLVVFQFFMSMLLIVGTLTIYRQINYIKTKNLGINKANTLYLQMEDDMLPKFETFKQKLSQQPGIAHVTTSSQSPLSVGNSTSDPTWEGKDPEADILFHIINSNYDFIKTVKMELLEGRDFSREFGTDTSNYIINEAAARAMGMENPIGENLEFWDRAGKIIGVVKDFHFQSFYEPIEPLIIRLHPENTWMIFMRTQPGQTQEALASLEEVHQQFFPEYPVEYRFLDEEYAESYKSEMVIGKLASAFAIIAVFISCLGLLGLAAFATEQRTREIGIRKVMGASVSQLVLLLSRDFTRLVLISLAFAVPVAYLLMDQWLSDFEYRIKLGFGVFVVAGVATILISWLTVSYQSIRAASVDPVESLRTE